MKNIFQILFLFLLINGINENHLVGQSFIQEYSSRLPSLTLKLSQGHQSAVSAADFSPDGSLLATVSIDGVVKVWESSSGRELYDFEGYGDIWDESHSIVFSKDGTYLLNISGSGEELFVWDLSIGESINPDTSSMMLERRAGFYSVTLKNPNEGKTNTHHFAQKSTSEKSNKLSPDSTLEMMFGYSELYLLATESRDTLWNILWNEDFSISPCPLSDLFDATFSPCGNYIGAVCWHSGIVVYDIRDRSIFRKFWFSEFYEDEDFNYAESTSGGRKVTFSPDGNYILGFDRYNTVLWEIESGNVIFRDKNSIPNIAIFSPSGEMVLTASTDGGLSLYSIIGGHEIRRLCPINGKIIFGKLLSNGFDIYFSKEYHQGPYVRYIWDIIKGELSFVYRTYDIVDEIDSLSYHSDRFTVLTDNQQDYSVIEIHSGIEYFTFNKSSHSFLISQYSIDPFYSYSDSILVVFGNDRIEFYNFIDNKKLYTLYLLGEGEYLVVDEHYRFDGSPNARQLLYFVCGLEIIGLNQLKDSLYVPGLASKILKGEDINFPKLSELEICDVLVD